LGPQGNISRGYSDRSLKVALHLHLVQELRIREDLPPLQKRVYGEVRKYSDNLLPAFQVAKS